MSKGTYMTDWVGRPQELRFPQRKDLCGIPQSNRCFCLWYFLPQALFAISGTLLWYFVI